MWIGIALLVAILLVLLWILLFTEEGPLVLPTPTPTATPTSTFTPTLTPTFAPTETPTPIPQQTQTPTVSYGSNGLGLAKTDWDAGHTVTGLGMTLGQTQATVYDDAYAILFINDNVG